MKQVKPLPALVSLRKIIVDSEEIDNLDNEISKFC